MRKINFEWRKLRPLPKKLQEKIEQNTLSNGKYYHKVKDLCHYNAAHSIYNLKHGISKEIFVVFHNE